MRLQNQTFGLRSSSPGLVLALLAVLHQANSAEGRDTYEHCEEDSDGVHDLDCFGKHSVTFPEYFCTWKPGRGSSVKTYTLYISYPGTTIKGRPYPNIIGTSANITVHPNLNMSAELFEKNNSGICTKAVFQGLMQNLVRCGPPDSVSFSRFAGRIAVNVTWKQVEMQKIGHFAVNYSSQGSWLGQRPLQSENTTSGTVEAVNSSLAYTVQVRCVNNSECKQCMLSHDYHVPAELTTAPDLDEHKEADVAEMPGRRRLSLTWKFASKTAHDGYKVTISKASGETPSEQFQTTEPRITFILSYSSYHLEISAFNNASTSPALHHTIRRREDQLGLGTKEPDVTVQNNREFTISLRDNLTEKYVCYCAEWMERGREAGFKPYYSRKNSRTLKDTLEPLEPYRRYTLTVHVRDGKDPCGIKHINSSESTYGSTQFYYMEGSPVGAPANVSSYNVTLDSAALQWSSIPEEDTRGFLLGYVIYYAEDQKGTRTEKNVTAKPDVNSHTLKDLKSGTLYEVQISGFTRTGVGVRSNVTAFTTDHHDHSPLSGIIKLAAIMTALLLFGCPIIKRAKHTLWPSIPNPEKSNVMQKMQMSNELELLQSISTLRVEEWDTDSLQIVQKEQVITACISAEMPSLLDGPEDEFGDIQETHVNDTPLAGGYSTMETFRQAVLVSTLVSPEREHGVTVLRSQLDYIRQFSADSTWDNQTLA